MLTMNSHALNPLTDLAQTGHVSLHLVDGIGEGLSNGLNVPKVRKISAVGQGCKFFCMRAVPAGTRHHTNVSAKPCLTVLLTPHASTHSVLPIILCSLQGHPPGYLFPSFCALECQSQLPSSPWQLTWRLQSGSGSALSHLSPACLHMGYGGRYRYWQPIKLTCP